MTLDSSIAVLAWIATTSSLAAEFRVGFASDDITPPVGWRHAGYYTETISSSLRA